MSTSTLVMPRSRAMFMTRSTAYSFPMPPRSIPIPGEGSRIARGRRWILSQPDSRARRPSPRDRERAAGRPSSPTAAAAAATRRRRRRRVRPVHLVAQREQLVGFVVHFHPVAARAGVDLADDAFGNESRVARFETRDPLAPPPAENPPPAEASPGKSKSAPACSWRGRSVCDSCPAIASAPSRGRAPSPTGRHVRVFESWCRAIVKIV